MLKQVTITWPVDITVNTRSLHKLVVKSSMLYTEFYVENPTADILGGYPLRLFSKSGTGSINLYFEDIEHGIKKWCKSFHMIHNYLQGHRIFLEDLSTKDANYILDEAIDHQLQSKF